MTIADLDDGRPVDEEELTALALAADPDTPVAPDALPFAPGRATGLPTAYLPAASRRSRPGGPLRTVVVGIVVAAFVVITALGFCVTYGQLVHA